MAEQNEAPGMLGAKAHDAPSVFRPENLLREARRQRRLPATPVPAVCALDPDGDIVRALRANGRSRRTDAWACYHTEMDVTEHDGVTLGIVGLAVGAPFAVLVAEQLFVSGCRLLISVTSAGQIAPVGPPPYFVLIDRALRDEGTSHHYLPPSLFAAADPELAELAWPALCAPGGRGASGRDVDHRRAVPRNRGRDRRGSRARRPRGRDGGGGALRLRPGAPPRGAVLRACDQQDGRRRRRLRERRG